MSSNPLITVIIPTFNREDLLFRALESITKQSYQNFELIVVDDGSTDDTKQKVDKFILENLKKKITYIAKENGGVSSARNMGIKEASGEWIAFLDSDDEWLPHKLQKQVDYMISNLSIKLIHGEEIWIRRGKRVNQKNIHKKSGGWIFKNCLKLCLISPSAVIIRKDFLFEMGLFDEEFTVCEDYDLWLKITSLYEVGFIIDPIIIKHGGHDDQLSSKYFAMDYYRIKSMNRILEIRDLNDDYKITLIDELKSKGEILLKGYKKHNNLKNYDEIDYILKNCL